MTGVSKEYGGGLDPGTSGMMETTMMEGEEFYTPETAANADAAAGGDWPGKIPTSQLCRVCANPNEYLIPIFEGEGLEHELGTKIQKHLPIEVTESDTLPLHMCYNCASTLIAWNDMVVGCVEADKKLRQLQQEEENEEDYDDKAVFYDTPAIDSDTADDPIEPSTSAAPARGKRTVKEKKPRLRPPAKAAAASKSRLSSPPKAQEDASAGDSANERSQPPPPTPFKVFREQNIRSTGPRRKGVGSSGVVELSAKKASNWSSAEVEEELAEAVEKPTFECAHCSKVLASRENMRVHLRIHTGECPFTCHVCGKQFKAPSTFTRHLREVHERVRDHHCSVCGRGFANRRTLEDHSRTHTGERPYTCGACGRTYKTKASLNHHKKCHLDFYPVHCSHCGKGCRTSAALAQHFLTHTGEKPHSCDVCGKRFSVKNEMRRHRLVHSDKRPFMCGSCGLTFKQRRYLRNHERTHHKPGH